MANAGPGTNGSQFFLVYKDSLTLPANYTPFGTIVSGLKIVQNVAKAGSDNANGQGDGHPKEKVVIKQRHHQEDLNRHAPGRAGTEQEVCGEHR